MGEVLLTNSETRNTRRGRGCLLIKRKVMPVKSCKIRSSPMLNGIAGSGANSPGMPNDGRSVQSKSTRPATAVRSANAHLRFLESVHVFG